MTQRQLNQWVARLRERAGLDRRGRKRVLSACHRAMRELRGLEPMPEACDGFALNGEVDAAAEAMLREDDALGRIYQALNAPTLESSYRATARDRRKFKDSEIPAVTQLFTPRWVVEFLLHNTLGRLWREWHPDSCLQFKWLIDPLTEAREPFRPASSIRVVDPACGTMNFGLIATEMLQGMYREEMDRAGKHGWPADPSVLRESEITTTIFGSNLCGADIDATALELAQATLSMKFGESGVRLFKGDALLHHRIERSIRNADVVVTNPPYLSARNLPTARVAKLKRRFPNSWRDAYACFIERCLELARPGGRVGMLTMHSFMFTGAFEGLRKQLAESATIESIAHFGGSLFAIGNPGTLQTVAFTAKRGRDDAAIAVAIRLVDAANAEDKRRLLESAISNPTKQHRLNQSELHAFPRNTWAYWMSPVTRSAWRTMPTLGDIAPPRQGLATTDNKRFVRYWWEVEGQSPQKWRPYAKGGQSRRWYQSPMHRVNWEDDGAAIKQSICARYPYLNGKWEWVAKNSDYYGREGITYSYLTSGQFSARWMPAGSWFDVAGSALFPDDPLTILGILNSSAARKLLHAINPTVNFQVGDLRQLPIPREGNDRLRQCVQEAMRIQKALDEFDETSCDFIATMSWDSAASQHCSMYQALRHVESEIESITAGLYGVAPERESTAAEFDPIDLAKRWLSFAIRTVLKDIQCLEVRKKTIDRIRGVLVGQYGSVAATEIERHVGGIENFLSSNFAGWLNRLYKRRPPILVFGSREQMYLVNHRCATARAVGPIIERLGGKIPRGWDRYLDDGIQINLAPLHRFFADAETRKQLLVIYEDLKSGRLAWSETARALAEH